MRMRMITKMSRIALHRGAWSRFTVLSVGLSPWCPWYPSKSGLTHKNIVKHIMQFDNKLLLDAAWCPQDRVLMCPSISSIATSVLRKL
jgi:hypothetical protein